MKIFLGILFLYFSGYAVDTGNNPVAFWWFLAGMFTLISCIYDKPKDPPGFT